MRRVTEKSLTSLRYAALTAIEQMQAERPDDYQPGSFEQTILAIDELLQARRDLDHYRGSAICEALAETVAEMSRPVGESAVKNYVTVAVELGPDAPFYRAAVTLLRSPESRTPGDHLDYVIGLLREAVPWLRRAGTPLSLVAEVAAAADGKLP